MGKSTISMAIFNSYVKLPDGRSPFYICPWDFPRSSAAGAASAARWSKYLVHGTTRKASPGGEQPLDLGATQFSDKTRVHLYTDTIMSTLHICFSYYVYIYIYIHMCVLYVLHILLCYIYYNLLYYIILYYIILHIMYNIHLCVDVVTPKKIEDSKIPAKYGQIQAVLYLFGKILGVEILMKSDGTLKSCHFGFRRRPHPKMTLLLGSHLQYLISNW